MNTYVDQALWQEWDQEWMPRTSPDHNPAAYRAELQRYEQERNRRRLLFMTHHGLKQSQGIASLSRVVGKQLYAPVVHYRLYDEKVKYPLEVGWFDHSELFYRSKKEYVLTTQPYDLTEEKVAALRELCMQWDLTVEVLPSDGWHYPGRCPLVVVRKQQKNV